MNAAAHTDILARTAEEMRQYVLERCSAQSNMMSGSYYDVHLRFVEDYALRIAPHFGANQGLVRIAALSHDLGAITDYAALAQHHMTGADIASKLLEGKIPDGDIAVIADAIRHHNMPVRTGSPEAIALSHADGLSKFDSPVYWICYAWKRKFDSFEESVKWYEALLANTYAAMDPEVRKLIDGKYEAAKRIIASAEGKSSQ